MLHISGINKVRNRDMQSIPASILDSSLFRAVVFETLKHFSRSEIQSFGGVDGELGDKH